MGTNTKLKRTARQLKAIRTDDPEGLLSTLQVMKRLVIEAAENGESITMVEALNDAVTMSAPKDEVRVWWSAIRVLFRHTDAEKSGPAILADAIVAQGKMNVQIKKKVRL